MNSNKERYTLLAVGITSFLTPFTGSAINIAIPAMGKSLAADVVTMTWMATGFLLASAAFAVPVGRMADLRGRKPLFMIGVAIFGAASLAGGIATSAPVLIAMRMLQGLGGAFVFGTGMAMLAATYPPNLWGKVLGINAAVVYVGISAGPVLGGFITHYLGWRYIFYVSFGLAILALWAARRVQRDTAPAHGQTFDLPGSLLYVTGLLATMYGLSIIVSSAWGKWLLAAGLLLLALFVRHELGTASPLIQIKLLLRNRPFAFSNLAALINYMATTGVSFLFSIYLQVVKGLNPQVAGLVLLSQPIIVAAISPFSGRLSDRVEPQIVATAGMVLTVVGLVMFQFAGNRASLSLIVLILLIMGAGFGLFGPPNNNAVMSTVDAHQHGIASSIISTMRLVGQTLSMTVVTLIIAVVMGKIQVVSAHAGLFLVSMKTAFAIFTVLCLGGTFASLARGNLHTRTYPGN